MLEILKSNRDEKNLLIDLLAESIQLKKDLANIKIGQQKLYKLKHK